MTKLIRNWEELAKVPPTDKLKIEIDEDMCCGWIKPIDDNVEIEYGKNYHYLSTHTFYGSQYKYSTKLLQECGFDIEIDNWDKGSDNVIGGNLDYSMYGVFNGKPMIPSYNREERRKYIRTYKNSKEATYCDFCKAKTLKITDDNCEIVCELCGRKQEGKNV